MNWIFAYYQAIKDGTELVGKWTRLIYEYLARGLEAGLFFYDAKKANGAISWMESHCFHTKGPLAPGALRFELWQKALIAAIFGIVDEKGRRQFWEVLLVIGRKDGKSLLGSAIADYFFREVGGYGAEVYCVAPKLDQAGIIYDTTWKMIELDPEYKELKEHCNERDCRGVKINDQSMLPKKRRSDFSIDGTNAIMKKIAFAAKTADGWNPSLCLCDEIAAWPGDKGKKMYEVMESGTGARADALLVSMTTSGYENDGIYDELMKRSTRLLLGDSREQHLLPVIYMIDDVDKWNDINELKKSMPMLGKSISVDYILNGIAVAEQSLSKKAEFLTKFCNIKQNSSMAWLNTQDVQKNFSGHPLSLEDFRETYAVAGIDLSQTTDLTAAVLLIEKGGKIYTFAHFWMPGDKVEEATARDGVPYRAFIQRGMLSQSGENFVDYKDVEKWFQDFIEKYEIYPLKVGYDRYSAQYLVQDLSAYGFQMDDVFQGENLTPVINEVDGMIRDGRFDMGDNDLLKIHLLNSALKMNNDTNRKRLVKIAQTQRIDGMAAFLDAMCVRQKWWNEIGEQLKNED